MRKFLAVSILSLALAACDSSTGGDLDSALGLEVVTGTASAPVDTPTVRLSWGRSDTVAVMYLAASSTWEPIKIGSWYYREWDAFSPADTIVNVPCASGDSLSHLIAEAYLPANWDSVAYADTLTVYCAMNPD